MPPRRSRGSPAGPFDLGESCDFFPITDAQRLASEFPRATLVSVPGGKTWVPIDSPVAVADAIIKFVPTPGP
jgi:hypothetical protein